MTRSILGSLLAVAAVVWLAGVANAQSATVYLDVYYSGDSNNDGIVDNANSTGTFALNAKGSNEGIAGLNVLLTGALPTQLFQAVTGTAAGVGTGFRPDYANGTKPFNLNTDGNAATTEMLFGQIPLASGSPQVLAYGVGVATGNVTTQTPAIAGYTGTGAFGFADDLLGDVSDNDQSNNNGAGNGMARFAAGTVGQLGRRFFGGY